MFKVYLSDDVYTCADASDAVDIYNRGVSAGKHPSLWRDGDLIVHVAECSQCGELVLMSKHDVNTWLGAFGDDLVTVMCGTCINEMLNREEALAQQEQDWDREVEIMLFNSAHIEQ